MHTGIKKAGWLFLTLLVPLVVKGRTTNQESSSRHSLGFNVRTHFFWYPDAVLWWRIQLGITKGPLDLPTGIENMTIYYETGLFASYIKGATPEYLSLDRREFSRLLGGFEFRLTGWIKLAEPWFYVAPAILFSYYWVLVSLNEREPRKGGVEAGVSAGVYFRLSRKVFIGVEEPLGIVKNPPPWIAVRVYL